MRAITIMLIAESTIDNIWWNVYMGELMLERNEESQASKMLRRKDLINAICCGSHN